MQFTTGTYTGDGNDNRSISGVGFQPDLVRLKGDTAQRAVFRTATMAGDNTAQFASNLALFANGIQALEADGFQLGTDARVNGNGITYHYAAIRDNGDGDFTESSYTGDGNDNRSISGVGFQPTFLTVKSAGATYAVWRVDENPGDDTLDFWASTNSANMVQAFEADGFQIGTSDKVNSNEVTYYYFAFKDIANAFQTGTYAGDGNDDRSLAASLTPEMVWVKGDLAASCYLRTDTMAAGDSGDFQNAALTTDRIQSFPTTNFQVGTSAEVNTLNETYYWAAWATPPGGAANAMPQAMNHYRRRR